MTGDQIGQLTYLLLLGAVLAFWLFIERRTNLGTKIKYLAAWGFIFLGAIAVVGLWSDIRRHALSPKRAMFAAAEQIELARQPDGHYHAQLMLNGVPVEFVVDTGASAVVLTKSDAERIGIATENLPFVSEAMTANGPVRTALVRLDSVVLGPFTDTGVQAFVNSGDMDQSLLGMTYLERFAKIEISSGKLVLSR